MNKTRAILLVLAGLLLVGAYFVYELIDTDAPDSVSTEAALEQIAVEAAADDADDATSADTDSTDDAAVEDSAADTVEAAAAGVTGTWAVDNDFGEFDFSTASGSFAGFRVEKFFFSGQGATAVGRSGEVTGSVTIGEGELSAASITVDMTEIVSDDSARVGAIKDAVQTDAHPTATFEVATPVTLDTDALDGGDTVLVDVVGTLTIAGTANEVTVPIEATIVEPGFGIIIGSADLVWADFGVETPESSVADVADEGVLEFQLVVRNS